MSKELDAFKRIRCNYVYVFKARENGKTQLVHDLNTIEQALEQAEENEKMLNVFKNALTLETKQNVVLPLDHSEDIFGYSVRTLTEIKQNELDNDLKKELREWVLKNAFPKELKVLDIIKQYLDCSIFIKQLEKYYDDETIDLLKEVLL